jgi:biopolymer transport protein ExbD
MDEKGFDSINVIPLVDVMLVLLTIVLTTSTFIAVGAIPVELPIAENSSPESLHATTIEITRQGELYIDAELSSLVHIRNRLTEKQRSQPILIRADKDIGLQLFVDVMDVVKGLGFRKVSLQTESSQ